MSSRFVLSLLLSAMAVPGAFAQGDPHMSTSEKDGSFVVNFHGVQRDGTVCPPSANALTTTINDGERIRGLTSLGVTGDTDPTVAAMFEGSCRVAFDGHLWVGIHHGTNARVTPRTAEAVEILPVHEGLFSVDYNPVICIMAPCNDGRYAITDEAGQLLAHVDAILVEGPAGSTIYRDRELDWESDIGTIWLDNTTLPEMQQFEIGEIRARIQLESNL